MESFLRRQWYYSSGLGAYLKYIFQHIRIIPGISLPGVKASGRSSSPAVGTPAPYTILWHSSRDNHCCPCLFESGPCRLENKIQNFWVRDMVMQVSERRPGGQNEWVCRVCSQWTWRMCSNQWVKGGQDDASKREVNRHILLIISTIGMIECVPSECVQCVLMSVRVCEREREREKQRERGGRRKGGRERGRERERERERERKKRNTIYMCIWTCIHASEHTFMHTHRHKYMNDMFVYLKFTCTCLKCISYVCTLPPLCIFRYKYMYLCFGPTSQYIYTKKTNSIYINIVIDWFWL